MLQHAVGDGAGEAAVGEGQGRTAGDAQPGIDAPRMGLARVGQERIDAEDRFAGQGDLHERAVTAADVEDRLGQIGGQLGEQARLDRADQGPVNGQGQQVGPQVVPRGWR